MNVNIKYSNIQHICISFALILAYSVKICLKKYLECFSSADA